MWNDPSYQCCALLILTCKNVGVNFCYMLQVIKVDHDAHGVDTPEDVEKIEALMRQRNLS